MTDIKHYTEDGVEFWYARELQGVLEYKKWRNFLKVIDKAKKLVKMLNKACLNVLLMSTKHPHESMKMILASNSENQ